MARTATETRLHAAYLVMPAGVPERPRSGLPQRTRLKLGSRKSLAISAAAVAPNRVTKRREVPAREDSHLPLCLPFRRHNPTGVDSCDVIVRLEPRLQIATAICTALRCPVGGTGPCRRTGG
jgi:hypothetical protein